MMHTPSSFVEIARYFAGAVPEAYPRFLAASASISKHSPLSFVSECLDVLREESQAEIAAVTAEWQAVIKAVARAEQTRPERSARDNDANFEQKSIKFEQRLADAWAPFPAIKARMRDVRWRESGFRRAPLMMTDGPDAVRASYQLLEATAFLMADANGKVPEVIIYGLGHDRRSLVPIAPRMSGDFMLLG